MVVHRDPAAAGYASVRTVEAREHITSHALPDLPVDQVFAPARA